MIPLLHDFESRRVLVFGGGPVGARKARRFDREARVLVVSPAFEAEEFGDADLVRARPGPNDVPGWIDRTDPALVVAATDDERVNEAVERAARDRNVLVNRADVAGGRDPGGVVVPATVRESPVVVGVATGGRSPAVSRELRRRLADELSGAGAVAEATAAVRRELRERGVPGPDRRAAVRAVAESERVWHAARDGGDAAVVAWGVVDETLEEEPSES